MNEGLHIALQPERLFEVWGIPITNSLLSSWVVMVVLVVLAAVINRRISLVPKGLQNAFEAGFEYAFSLMEQLLGTRELAMRFFPFIMTIFIFIFAANMFHFLPLIGSVGLTDGHEFYSLLRAPSTDLNVPLALAIISFLVVEVTGILTLGVLKYGSKFVNLQGGLVGFLVGVVELIGNLARLISLSFRLFGNIFAGEVLLLVIASFAPLIVPLPFMLFEVFIGFLQAAIFALLTLAFIKIAIEEPHSGQEAHA